MSDTFGASDLNNDLPGIGPAPGNARGAPVQLPSQLQSLVQHFFGQSTGQPNPKFLPPVPGPGGQQKPRLGPTDAPDPTVRNIAPVPANAPHPPPGFTPFIRPMPRDSSQWGQPEAFPRLPQSFELPGMYSQLGNYFAQHGGFASAPMGAGTAAFAAAYQDAFQKGQEWKMRMAKEQLAMHSAQLEELERTRMIGYADIFSRHSIEGTDPHDDLWRKAVEGGDKDVTAMLENGDSAEKIRRWLADHEAHIRSLGAANAKQTEADAASELYGLNKGGGGGAGAYDAYTNPTGLHGGAPASEAAPAAPTGEVAGPGAPSTDARKPGAETDPLSPDKGADADEVGDPIARNRHNAAVEVLKGNEPKDIPPQWLPYAGVEAGDLRRKLGQIIANTKAGRIAPDQVIPEVRKQVGSNVANDLQGVLDYSAPGFGGGSQGSAGGKEAEYRQLLGNIAQAIKPTTADSPGWTASFYHDRDVFRNGPALQNTIGRISTVSTTGAQLMAAVDQLPDQSGPTMQRMWDAFQGGTLNDPRYVAVFNAWQRYNMETNVLIRGGAGGITETESSVANVKPWGGPAAYRAAIKQDAENTLARVRQLHQRWDQIGGGPGVAWDLPGEAGLDILSKINPADGAITGPDGVKRKYLGLNPNDPTARENWEIIP